MAAPSTFWSPAIAGLSPYTAGEQPQIPGLVKLNTNENPYPPSPRVVAAIAAAADRLQLYPDPDSMALRRAVAAASGMAPAQIFVGNGSDEVLAHAFCAFFQQAAPLLMPDVTYSFYQSYCRLYGITPQTVPLDAEMRIDLAAFAATAGQPVAGLVLANPNAPTGIALPLSQMETLLQLHPERVMLVDEAYVDFGAASAVALVDRYPNLLVVQTLSKSRSLAGLRVGLAFGQSHLIEALERVKNSFNAYPLDCLAMAGAAAAYEDRAYFEKTRAAVMDSREGLSLQLEDLGFTVLPSQANFVFATHARHDAAALAAALRERAVLVRHFQLPRTAHYLRISIGTPAHCDALLQALADILGR